VDALKDGQRLAMNLGVKVSPKNPENSTEILHYTKLALDDKIAALAAKEGTGNDVRALTGIRDKLVSLIESKDFSPSYREARDSEDEKHVHPLQLDVIDRCVELFSNPGETVFTPFMGVGSEVYSPVILGRRGMGAELKAAYYRQAIKNVQAAAEGRKFDAQTGDMFDELAAEVEE
jgi:DNA modification methylase